MITQDEFSAAHSRITPHVRRTSVIELDGAAVGYAAAKLGIPARIFVPGIAGEAKISLVRGTGAMAIHSFDAPETLAGQGTVGAEMGRSRCAG